jgi:hypothetical protein
MASQARKSIYLNDSPVTGVPGPVVFNGVCPGYWSRRYLSMNDAAALTGGSGYFGYPASGTTGSSGYWSTNFVDDGVYASNFVFTEGSYYSKNVVLNKGKVLLGVVVVDGNDIKLKWGSTWGAASRNSMMDYSETNSDGTYTIRYRSFTVPRLSNGALNTVELNRLVMKGAPTRGAFVQLDLDNSIFTYLCTDGEQNMYPLGAQQQVTIQSRDATDPTSLPLSSKMYGLPVMQSGTYTLGGGSNSLSSVQADITSVPDRSREWLPCLSSVWTDPAMQYAHGTLAQARAYTETKLYGSYGSSTVSVYSTGIPYGIVPNHPDATTRIYSGWVRQGTPNQMVGYISKGKYVVCTQYGFTSVSPTAKVNNSSDFFYPTSADVLPQICSRWTNNASASFHIGFLYDASIGDYGKVTWLSQF